MATLNAFMHIPCDLVFNRVAAKAAGSRCATQQDGTALGDQIAHQTLGRRSAFLTAGDSASHGKLGTSHGAKRARMRRLRDHIFGCNSASTPVRAPLAREPGREALRFTKRTEKES